MSGNFLDRIHCHRQLRAETPAAVAELLEREPDLRSLFVYGCGGREWSVISRLTQVEELAVNPWKHRDFEPLRPLTRVRRLDLNVYGRLEDLRPLADLTSLESLQLHGATFLRDLSPLAELPNLRHLRIYTWVGQITLDSTAQLTGLTRLETLELNALRFRAGSIREVARLSALRELSLDNRFSIEDCAWLASRMPQTNCWLFEPISDNGVECHSCGRRGVQLIGAKRNRFVCPDCAPHSVAKHVARFEELKRVALDA